MITIWSHKIFCFKASDWFLNDCRQWKEKLIYTTSYFWLILELKKSWSFCQIFFLHQWQAGFVVVTVLFRYKAERGKHLYITKAKLCPTNGLLTSEFYSILVFQRRQEIRRRTLRLYLRKLPHQNTGFVCLLEKWDQRQSQKSGSPIPIKNLVRCHVIIQPHNRVHRSKGS